jgi:hypothetical protein
MTIAFDTAVDSVGLDWEELARKPTCIIFFVCALFSFIFYAKVSVEV